MSLIEYAERGLIPDALIRYGIRRLCRQRLNDEGAGDCAVADARFNTMIAMLKQSPIAIETAAANAQHYELPTEFFQLCLGKRLKYFQNAFGAVLSPFDSFLLSRGIKTLKVRLEAAQKSAQELAERLKGHPSIARVWFPGLTDFPGRNLHFSQATGAGAILSFELKDAGQVKNLLENVKLPIIAPSLGGVETILTHCWSMSHAAIPAQDKLQQGITKSLLRISVGLEDVDDLWEDLEKGLN